MDQELLEKAYMKLYESMPGPSSEPLVLRSTEDHTQR